jgi:hypothetical protein
MKETADWDTTPHLGPAISFDQFLDDGLQRNPVQRIAGMSGTHERMAADMRPITRGESLIAYSTKEEPLVDNSWVGGKSVSLLGEECTATDL